MAPGSVEELPCSRVKHSLSSPSPAGKVTAVTSPGTKVIAERTPSTTNQVGNEGSILRLAPGAVPRSFEVIRSAPVFLQLPACPWIVWQ